MIKRRFRGSIKGTDIRLVSLSYGVTFVGPMPTWDEGELEIVDFTFYPVVDDEDFLEQPEEWLDHNPEEQGFPETTARYRLPDVGLNDLLFYSYSSRSYACVKRHEDPHVTSSVVERLRAGWTLEEIDRAN